VKGEVCGRGENGKAESDDREYDRARSRRTETETKKVDEVRREWKRA